MHGRGRLIRFKIGESNLILPYYSTCLEIRLSVWDSSPEGNSTRTSSLSCQALGGMCTALLLLTRLCALRDVCARTALQASGSSFLAHDLHHEKWASMVNIRWHESPALIENSQRGLGSNSVSGGRAEKHVVTFLSFASRFLLLPINPGLTK